jgi:CubicO group peptidase (beta-lactamase class C family)
MAQSRISESFQNEGDLSSRLAAICARRKLQKTVLGLLIDGRRMFAGTSGATRLDPPVAQSRLVPAACLTKPITATLLAQAISTCDLGWSHKITDVLALAGPQKAKLAGVTLAHLLNHTHGLDAATASPIPRTPEGFVDVDGLCDRIAAKPLSSPGRLYNYSNFGVWLAAAALEKLSSRHYTQLLHHAEWWANGRDSQPLPPEHVCPATGNRFELTVSQWLDLLEAHIPDLSGRGDPALTRVLASLRTSPVPLPGWSPSELGACLGWKYYGADWFGHNANPTGSSALLRFNPKQRIAVVVEAADSSAFIVLAALFGTALPEFSNLRPLRLLNPQESAGLHLDGYAGAYVQAQSRLSVGVTSQGRLYMRISTQDSKVQSRECVMRPAERQMFIPETRDEEFPFVQFVAGGPPCAFEYVWNGKQLWRHE